MDMETGKEELLHQNGTNEKFRSEDYAVERHWAPSRVRIRFLSSRLSFSLSLSHAGCYFFERTDSKFRCLLCIRRTYFSEESPPGT